MTEQRRLAAIMFTDIVGYTRLMSEDEQKALECVRNKRAIIQPLLKQFNGEFLKELGDGTLSAFTSSVDAVRCAVALQQALADQPDYKIRVGIHLGDVVSDDGDIFGDGVNIASRIESQSEPGGIAFSEQIYESVRNQSDIDCHFVGEKNLKNVGRPIKIYSIKPQHQPDPKKSRTRNWLMQALVISFLVIVGFFIYNSLQSTNKSPTVNNQQQSESYTIAVLPLNNLSSDSEQEYFSDGLTEELLNVMTRTTDLKVISRASAFRFKDTNQTASEIGKQLNADYLLEGSVRKSGSMIRVTMNLLDAKTEERIWSDNFERQISDIFALQDSIAAAVVASLKVEFLGISDLTKRTKINPEAYELYLQALKVSRIGSSQNHFQAEQYLKQALSLEPDFIEARLKLAHTYFRQMQLYMISVKEGLQKTEETLDLVLQNTNDSADAYSLLGNIRSTYYLDWEGALQAYEKALSLSPNHPRTLKSLGYLQASLGDVEKGLMLTRQSRKLDPLTSGSIHNEGYLSYMAGDYKAAERLFKEALDFAGEAYSTGNLMLGLALVADGRPESALEYINKEPSEAQRMSGQIVAMKALGQTDEALRLLNEFSSKYGENIPVPTAGLHAQLGNFDKAFEWFDKAYEKKDPNLMSTMVHPINEPLKSDPRFEALLIKLNLKEGTKKIGYPADNLLDDNYTLGEPWNLVWSDEFNGSEINPDNWTHQVLPAGRFNKEWQRYTDRPENAFIENGYLVIKALQTKEGHGEDHYSSARLHTAKKQTFKHIKFD